ncbi:PE domain-containing protein, partial [Mycobacterium sp.]|uniref:PE domain-containing protein n=1 Tax=Mycobacterium sp. TaxID=1785 RepID=UPI003C78E385
MSAYVIAAPDALAAASADLTGLGEAIREANAAAAASTTSVLAAGADEVSAAIAGLFGMHAQEYQALSAQVTAFHDRFVHTLSGGAAFYASAEAANASSWQQLLGLSGVNLGVGNIGRLNLGSGNTGNTNLGSGNTGDSNLSSGNRGNTNLGSGNTGNTNLGSGNLGSFNLGSGNGPDSGTAPSNF